MKFSLLPILLIIVLFGFTAVYSDCMIPTIVEGQVFVNGNLLSNGTIEICVENPQSCNTNSISDGIYHYAPKINDSGSNITLKIYDENNKFLSEKVFFIGCGSENNFDIYVNTSNQISSSSSNATTNETSETNNNVNTINQSNPPQTQPPTPNAQQNSNSSMDLHSMPSSSPSIAPTPDTSLNTSPSSTSISGSPSYNFSATDGASINDVGRSQETTNLSEYNVSNTSNNSGNSSGINFDGTTMYLLIVIVFLFIILIFLWKRSNK